MNDDIWVHFDKIPELKNDEILLAQINMEKITYLNARAIFQTLKSALPDNQILMIPDEMSIKKLSKNELMSIFTTVKELLWEQENIQADEE